MINCGDCTYCCKNTAVIPLDFETYHYKVNPTRELQSKFNGDCIYLNNGCSIYKDRPVMCQTYTCIGFWDTAIKQGLTPVTENPEFKQVVIEAKKRNEPILRKS